MRHSAKPRLAVRQPHAPAPGDESARLWHHRDLTGEIPVGSPVRVHEQYPAIAGRFGIINVGIDVGLGSVPDPEYAETWAQETSVGVVDLATGRGVDLSGR